MIATLGRSDYGSRDLALPWVDPVQVESGRWTIQVGKEASESYMNPKQMLDRRSVQERKVERQQLGTLRSLVIVVRKWTEERYVLAVSRHAYFYAYPTSFLALDTRVRDFVKALWHDGDSKAFASDCLSCLGQVKLV